MSDETTNGTSQPEIIPPPPTAEIAGAQAQPEQAPAVPETKKTPIAPELQRFVPYFGRPVAVQLRTAFLVIDAVGLADIGGHKVPVPGPVAENGNVIPQSVLMARLLPSIDGTHLVLRFQSPDTKAVMEVLLSHTDILYVTTVAGMPQSESLIIQPGAH